MVQVTQSNATPGGTPADRRATLRQAEHHASGPGDSRDSCHRGRESTPCKNVVNTAQDGKRRWDAIQRNGRERGAGAYGGDEFTNGFGVQRVGGEHLK